jgi:cytochrome b subunit of formate dehydrogenase
MEVFGGFMMMLSIIGFFLTVIWFILPFVIFNIKGRVDRTLFLVEDMEKRLSALERSLAIREVPVREGESSQEPPL